MRIIQELSAPRGVLGLTLLAFTLAFVALVLDQADYKSPILVWVFGILAGITALGALAAFFGPRISKSWAWAKEFLRLVGYPLLLGLLLGGTEWLVSASLYNALGIGTAAYALAQIVSGFWVPRLTKSLEQVHELTDEIEQVKLARKNTQTELDDALSVYLDTKRENTKLKQELERAKEDLEQARANASGFGAHTIEQEDSRAVIERLEAENERLRKQVASPEEAKQKRLCLYLADDLRTLNESFEQDERVLISQLEKRKSAGAGIEELEEERRAKQVEIEKRVLDKYHHGYWDRLEKLYDELEPHGWLGPNDESLFLGVNAPHEIVIVADRLAEVGHRL